MKRNALILTLAVLTALTGMSLRPFAGYRIGDIIQDFELKNVDGKSVSLKNRSDVKGYIITFTCNTCPVAQAYEERIIALNKKYESSGYPLIAIQPNDPSRSPGDSFQAMHHRARDKKYGFPYLIDDTQETARAFGATNTPHTFVVKKEGDKFRLVYAGAIDNNQGDAGSATKKYIESAIDELIAGKEVSNASVRAVGCGIKWKAQ